MKVQEATPLAESREVIQHSVAKSAPTDERMLFGRQNLDARMLSGNSTSVTD